MTDKAGETWIIYHAIDVNRPRQRQEDEVNSRRVLLMDRVEWRDGWPRIENEVRAPRAGTVEAVSVAVGETVELGDERLALGAGDPVGSAVTVNTNGARSPDDDEMSPGAMPRSTTAFEPRRKRNFSSSSRSL